MARDLGGTNQLRPTNLEVGRSAVCHGDCVAERWSAPLTEVEHVARRSLDVAAAARRDHDVSSRLAEVAADDPLDHDVMQFRRRLR